MKRRNMWGPLLGILLFLAAGLGKNADGRAIAITGDAVTGTPGQIVTYRITGTIPDTAGLQSCAYRIQAAMTEGLVFQEDVVVYFGEDQIATNPDYESTGNGFSVSFDMAKWQNRVGQRILVTFTAQIGEASGSSGAEEKCTAVLSCTHNSGNAEPTAYTVPAEETVWMVSVNDV